MHKHERSSSRRKLHLFLVFVVDVYECKGRHCNFASMGFRLAFIEERQRVSAERRKMPARRRVAAVAAMLCICSHGHALQMRTAQHCPTAIPRAPAPLLAVRDSPASRRSSKVADGAMAAKIQSRTSFEEHWSKDEHWLPRGDVQLPIDNELLYERLRAISNRTTPSRPLSKRQVGVATIRWLSRRTETSAQEYLDFYEGIASAQRFLQRRSAAAAAAAADAGAADAGADAPSADESMRASVAARFSPTAVQQRVDEALGPTPQVAELERLGISPREIAEVSLPLLLTLPLPLTRT